MEIRKYRNKTKKRSFFSRCPFLFLCVIFFFLMETGSAAASLSAGQMTWKEYFMAHLKEPGWVEYLTAFRFDGAEDLLDRLRIPAAGAENQRQAAGKQNADVSGNLKTAETQVSGNNTEIQKPVSGNNPPQSAAAEQVSGNEASGGQVSGNDTVSDNNQTTGYGMTRFVEYTPVQISSPYFQDRGRTPQTTDCQYQNADDSYFSDAAFLGDSRTLGLHDYAGWKEMADFYCDSGFSLYQWSRDDQIMDQRAGKKVDFMTAFSAKKYGKIYIMAGMNDLGYGNTQQFQTRLQKMITELKQLQPEAVIYLMGNLHMSAAKNNLSAAYNNVNLNDKNAAMAELADGMHAVYLDVNPLFTDQQGSLKAELTFDGFHLYATGYVQWADFIKAHTVSAQK